MISTMECSVVACDHPANATRGYCRTHYDRWRKHGDPLIIKRAVYPSRTDRFWAKVNKNGPTPEHALGPCWVWTGARSQFGYGNLTTNGKQENAHRVSWEIHFGPIPDGIRVLHACDNPPCVRPFHLFLGTQKDNNRDREAKGRGNHPTKAKGYSYWRGRQKGITASAL